MACILAGGHAIHTLKSATIGLLSSRDQKHRAGLKSKSPAAAKRRPAASGLSQDELLAKIDALDWDETITPDAGQAGGAGRSPYPDHSTSAWRVAAIVAGIVGVLAVGYVVLGPDGSDRKGSEAAMLPVSAADPQGAAGPVARTPDASAAESVAAVAAAEARRSALYAHAIEEAEAKASAQQKAEQQRKAREARKARQAERAKAVAQQERERRQKDEARARLEREAEEARQAKAREPAPAKGPSSPQEVCAGESNIFSRGICEARTCGKPEWRNHPFCVKRMEQQIPGSSPGGA